MKPVEEVLPREIEDKGLRELLDNFSKVIDEFVNFGTHLFKCAAQPSAGGDESLPLVMLFRHYIETIDSISLLVKASSIDPAKILLRAALETSFSIDYLLETDTHNRAMAFLVWHAHKMIKTYKKYDITGPEGQQLQQIINTDKSFSSLSIPNFPSVASAIANYQSLLIKPEYALAEADYQLLISNKERNPAWYRFFNGPKNIEGLARHLNSSGLYETLYRQWSGPVHGTDIIQGKLSASETGSPEIVQIRYCKDAQTVTSFALNITLKVYSLVIESALPAKKQKYGEWYLTIRDSFTRITSKEPLIVVE